MEGWPAPFFMFPRLWMFSRFFSAEISDDFNVKRMSERPLLQRGALGRTKGTLLINLRPHIAYSWALSAERSSRVAVFMGPLLTEKCSPQTRRLQKAS